MYVLRETCVQNRVGYLVRYFIGVAFRDGLGSENVPSGMFCHFLLSFFVLAKRIRGNIPNHRGFRSVGAEATRPRFLMQNRTG